MEVLTAAVQIAFSLLFLLACSLVMLLKPEWFWRLKYFLSAKGDEPSDLYIPLTRIGGMLLLFLTIGLGVWIAAKLF